MLLLRSGTICAHPVENRLGVIHGESMVFQQMLVQLIQIRTAHVEQFAAAGALQVKMLMALSLIHI